MSTVLCKLQTLGPKSQPKHMKGSSALPRDGRAARAMCRLSSSPRPAAPANLMLEALATEAGGRRRPLPYLFAFLGDPLTLYTSSSSPMCSGRETGAPGEVPVPGVAVTMQCSTREGHWRSVCFCCHLFPVQRCTVQDKPRLPTPSPGRTARPPPLPAEHPRASPGLDPPSPPWQGKNPTANQENQEDGSSASSPPRRHLWQLKTHRREIPALCFPRSFLQLSQVWSEFILSPDQE